MTARSILLALGTVGLFGFAGCETREPAACAPRASDDPVVVAIVDSGLAATSPTHAGVDPASRSFVAGEEVADDPSGHGTRVATLVHEAAPDARLMIVKVLDQRGAGSPAAVADGIRHAVDHGADIINVSLELPRDDPALQASLDHARDHRALVVVAAGNEGLDLDRFPSYPASAGHENLLVVAAADHDGSLTAGSNWGAHAVDIGVLGIEGSSFAAARASGFAARLVADDHTIDGQRLVAGLMDAAEPRPQLVGRVRSGGTLDASASIGHCAPGS